CELERRRWWSASQVCECACAEVGMRAAIGPGACTKRGCPPPGPFVQAFFCPLAGIMSGASESGPDGPSFGGKKRLRHALLRRALGGDRLLQRFERVGVLLVHRLVALIDLLGERLELRDGGVDSDLAVLHLGDA